MSRRFGTGFTAFDVDLQSPVGCTPRVEANSRGDHVEAQLTKSTKYSEAESLFEIDNKCCRSSSAEVVYDARHEYSIFSGTSRNTLVRTFDLPRCFEDRKDRIVVRGAFRKGLEQ